MPAISKNHPKYKRFSLDQFAFYNKILAQF